MNFIKRHKGLFITLIIILLLSIGAFFLVKKLFMIDDDIDVYGNRLEGIENVQVSDEAISKMKEEIKALEEVSELTYRLQGRLVYIELTLKDGVIIETAKEIGNKTLDYFSIEEKAFYDIQVIVNNENKEIEGYPKIGYKHKTSEALTW